MYMARGESDDLDMFGTGWVQVIKHKKWENNKSSPGYYNQME